MVRLALGGTIAFAAILTVVAWAQTTSTTQSTGSTATTSATTARPAASLPGINAPTHGTFLGAPGSDAIQPATPGTTFLGTVPVQSGPAITGATTSSPTTNVNGTTGTTATTGTSNTTTSSSTTLGDIALEAAVPVTVYYPAATIAQPQVAGTPVMLAQPTNGMAYQMVPTTGGQYIATPVVTNPRPVGTSGPGAPRAEAPVPSVARVADSDLLRAAQGRLRGVVGFADGRVTVDVERGIIMVRTRNLSRAERDRVFTSVREVHGAIGVIVK